jgi:methylenetetrahydrofolate reductase (NADPH)
LFDSDSSPAPVTSREDSALAGLLKGYSAEVTTRDAASIEAAAQVMAPGAEVFVASLPKDDPERLTEVCAGLREAGLEPVPHLVARNFKSQDELARAVDALATRAQVGRALVLGGDRDKPAGDLLAALQILTSGCLQANGLTGVYLGCYPEGHPRISNAALDQALEEKLSAAESAGLRATLVSQFCFEAGPIITMAGRFRDMGMSAPVRVGVAGPTSRAKLVKYALICGVGPSLRALKDRQGLAMNMLAGETPDELLNQVARARADDPALNIEGVHFFTFGGLEASATWAASATTA